MPDQAVKCWIFRVKDAKTGEHLIKHSDLRAVFGKPDQNQRFYFHDLQRANREVQSLRSDILKSPILICAGCNTTRTQPHDRAWEHMSRWLESVSRQFASAILSAATESFATTPSARCATCIFIFLKQLGGMILEGKGNVQIEVTPVADAIKNNRPHPEVYLQFGRSDGTVGRLVKCIKLETGHVLACLFYRVGAFTVNVIFAQAGGGWESLSATWHPRRSSDRFVITDFRWDEPIGELSD